MATATRSARRVARGIVASLLMTGLVAGTLGTGLSDSAHAEEGYRYWNYFHLENGEWAFSQVGASSYTDLEDGDVEGYRYGTSASSDTDGVPPRADLSEVTFDSICADQEVEGSQLRVAVVIDYGTEADADGATPPEPRTACAVVPAGANGQQVLNEVADVRVENELTCALDGYPAQGCGQPVAEVQAADEQPVSFQMPGDSADAGDTGASDDGSGLVWPLVGIAALVVLLAAGALVMSRRNRAA